MIKIKLDAGFEASINGVPVVFVDETRVLVKDAETVDQVAESAFIAGLKVDLSHYDEEKGVNVQYSAADGSRIETAPDPHGDGEPTLGPIPAQVTPIADTVVEPPVVEEVPAEVAEPAPAEEVPAAEVPAEEVPAESIPAITDPEPVAPVVDEAPVETTETTEADAAVADTLAPDAAPDGASEAPLPVVGDGIDSAS